ncbi:hypothetical protein M406DRAFT_75748 [Cryphonectria parasitica EP155]|uniref:Radical SAM core domain-containing protein n=1 Tax=Cryphonectria parasitica (strain ATCC 38755 / EP155) TaxID=660469 RepID=A0A9P5CS55_CRYP1|nr:uncharacterized protein M406DRAFT_75748 [Cryphonectria parasitica EP155]KAF3769264.1 hypothetical protein M406DRAFT_75748 [Cryphonectria parasitica EP155]
MQYSYIFKQILSSQDIILGIKRSPPTLFSRPHLVLKTNTARLCRALTRPRLYKIPTIALHSRAYGTTSPEDFWRKVPVYEHVTAKDFLSHRWTKKNIVSGKESLLEFLKTVIPGEIPYDKQGSREQSKEDLLKDVAEGIEAAAMAIRITPYMLSRINWQDPRSDPIFRQFIPLKSIMLPDHPTLAFDSLNEMADSPVSGLAHRYPDKEQRLTPGFLYTAISECPTNCADCTRYISVGESTSCVTKIKIKPSRTRWDAALAYVAATPQLHDVVISGGDTYYLHPEHIQSIGNALIKMPHIRRFSEDEWASALMQVAADAKQAGKSVALHTHFNHPEEISWVTEAAAQRLFESDLVVRNQSVLLRGINDDVETMSTLIRRLADNNNNPFVVDLPGGGGKRLGCSYESYDRETGISRFVAPAVTAEGAGGRGRRKPEVFEYYDPIDSTGLSSTGFGGRV